MSDVKWVSKSGIPIKFFKIKELPKGGLVAHFVESYDSKFGLNHKFADLKNKTMMVVNGNSVLNKQMTGIKSGELVKLEFLGETMLETGANKGYTFQDVLVHTAPEEPLADISEYQYGDKPKKGEKDGN